MHICKCIYIYVYINVYMHIYMQMYIVSPPTILHANLAMDLTDCLSIPNRNTSISMQTQHNCKQYCELEPSWLTATVQQ